MDPLTNIMYATGVSALAVPVGQQFPPLASWYIV